MKILNLAGNGNKAYFKGWYFKLQTKEGRALALIPAFNVDENGYEAASVQIIFENKSRNISLSPKEFYASREKLFIWAGYSIFKEDGIWLNILSHDFNLKGKIKFGDFHRPKGSFMGPFSYIPHMECAHELISMCHSLRGSLKLNGEKLDFDGGTAYIEADRGKSFPEKYLWTQCCWKDTCQNSIMLAAGKVPLSFISFPGFACILLLGGRSYRFASYKGGKIIEWGRNKIIIEQGPYRLSAELLEDNPGLLKAPIGGNMKRQVEENVETRVRYKLYYRERLIFEHGDMHGSFEYSCL